MCPYLVACITCKMKLVLKKFWQHDNWILIFSTLNYKTLLSIELTCKASFRNYLNEDFWKRLCHRYWPSLSLLRKDLVIPLSDGLLSWKHLFILRSKR
jgi:hypothetical protein